MIVKADMHVHSIYSEHPSEWFLQRIGAGESYSDPDYIYKTAKNRGMDFVTITDHNRIEGIIRLMDKHPNDTFMGVESTAYFPEDGCKVHILIYGFQEKHFKKIQKYRKNIYELRDYIKEKEFAYSVAHVNYSVNGLLKLEHIEKLILLFDVFEGINGGRSITNNRAIQDVMSNLTPSQIERLYDKYKIEPFSNKPWKKGFTAGSDDHAGLFIGKTYTTLEMAKNDVFTNQIAKKKGMYAGRSNDYQSLVFMVYKIAWEYSKTKSEKIDKKIISRINDLIFDPKPLSIIDKLKLKGANARLKDDDIIYKEILELIKKLDKSGEIDTDKRLSLVYDSIAEITDGIIINMANYFKNNIDELNLLSAFGKITSILPAVFLTVPFITALNHLFQDRELVRDFRNEFGQTKQVNKKVLWFTDTIDDLNGVSTTLKELSWLAHYEDDLEICIATIFSNLETKDAFPPNVLELNTMLSFTAPYYDKFILKVPSFLDSLKKIYQFNPDEIILSTPGFIGLIGMIAAKLLHIPCTGIYHNDFQEQFKAITDDDSLQGLLEPYIKWFYSSMDTVAVPTQKYVDILLNSGFDNSKIKIFNRWINTDVFKPILSAREFLQNNFHVNGGPILLFTGRVSKDKNLDFIIQIFENINKTNEDAVLMIVGDGPYLEELKNNTKDIKNVIFTGRLKREDLPMIYSGSDIFIFPSSTDTFGMSVLEAQACGLPCIVSNIGGPQEIIKNGESGYALPSKDLLLWTDTINNFIHIKADDKENYNRYRENAVNNVKSRYMFSIDKTNLFN